MIAHCNNELARSKISEMSIQREMMLLLLIGPEGDFSEE